MMAVGRRTVCWGGSGAVVGWRRGASPSALQLFPEVCWKGQAMRQGDTGIVFHVLICSSRSLIFSRGSISGASGKPSTGS